MPTYVTGQTWNSWNSPTASAATTTIITNTWQTWNQGTSVYSGIQGTGTATTYVTLQNTWETWAGATAASGTNFITNAPIVSPPHVQTQRLTRRESQDIRRRCKQSQRALHKAKRPERRAETLLLKALSRPQRLTWLKSNYFDFESKGRRYRIERGRVGNVFRLDGQGGKRICYCCHPSPNVPAADTAMAQWLMLMHNEESFLRMANIHWNRGINDLPAQQAA